MLNNVFIKRDNLFVHFNNKYQDDSLENKKIFKKHNI